VSWGSGRINHTAAISKSTIPKQVTSLMDMSSNGVVTLSSGEQTTALLPEIRQWHPSLFSSAPWRGHDECEWREQSGCGAVWDEEISDGGEGRYETLQTSG